MKGWWESIDKILVGAIGPSDFPSAPALFYIFSFVHKIGMTRLLSFKVTSNIFLSPSAQHIPLYCCIRATVQSWQNQILPQYPQYRSRPLNESVSWKKKYIDVKSFQETYNITVICMRLRLVLFGLLFLCLFDMVAHCRVKSVWKQKKKISKVVAWFCICCKLKWKLKMTKKKKKKCFETVTTKLSSLLFLKLY